MISVLVCLLGNEISFLFPTIWQSRLVIDSIWNYLQNKIYELFT